MISYVSHVPQAQVCAIYSDDEQITIAQYLPEKPGGIYDMENNRYLGTHQGLWRYTIGQKARIPGMAEQMVVAKKDVETNVLHVTRKS